ncbi:hypothetical protein WH47_05230 [Habropoda laboriosa]|uniref:Uncharacterized protein n=1 Tax=Habropoda laboriosa TaxID=597456 RepID=A0A0L7QU13_9HYME|nr:hypothetical protein WH47_05230 [Habropoda laboriosa]
MLDRNVVLVLRTRQERTERRLRHKKEANPPPMEPPPQLLNNNSLYIDLNMNFSDCTKQQPVKTKKESGVLYFLRPLLPKTSPNPNPSTITINPLSGPFKNPKPQTIHQTTITMNESQPKPINLIVHPKTLNFNQSSNTTHHSSNTAR